MTNYLPPLRSLKFVLDEVVGLDEVLLADRFEDIDAATVHMVLEEVGRFMTEVIAPTNVDGDQITTKWSEGGAVTAPESFTKAYRRLVDAGYGAIPFDPTYGGGGFPWVTALAIQEMMTSANMAFALCPLLTQGAIDAIEHHGSDEQKAAYLPKMLTGEWSGTMNLSEPQAGSDVGAVATKAEPVGDGSYRIKGQKIWITWGEHDMSDNIIHLVLARTPGAPPGTKGITMFLVPKFLLDADGNPGARNDVTCVSIEHKLGIHGSPTCVLSFGDADGAIGWPVGDEFTGMRNMFTMMNNARLSVGLQGLSVAERSYQMGLQYAQERLQGTAVGAERGVQSPIIEHADVRRMLMTQRSWIDAMRLLLYTNGAAMDRARWLPDADRREAARERADLLIPISKSLCTDLGVELTSLTIQIYGGMGFVEETGAAQIWRDSRIAPIYEGTNGIQAADLVGRKLPMRGGAVLDELLAEFDEAADALDSIDGMTDAASALRRGLATAREAGAWLLEHGAGDPNTMLAGSSPFLRLLGTVVCGGFMARQAIVAADHLDRGEDPDGFYAARLATAAFFETQIVPSIEGLLPSVQAGAAPLFALSPKQLV